MIRCELFRRHVGAFVDGELDPATSIEFERHLEACAECQEFVSFEVSCRDQVRDALGEVAAPASLALRVRAGLDALDAALGAVEGAGDPMGFERRAPAPEPARLGRWRHALPVTAAAAAVALIGVGIVMDNEADVSRASMFEDIVRLHSSDLPPDVSVPERKSETPLVPVDTVARYFRGKVRFPVRPAEFESRNVRLVGARLSHVREREAAALFYDLEGRRVTVVVTDAPVGQERSATRGRLFYEEVRGYTVPVLQRGGLTYAFTGDLDHQEMMRLVGSARVR